MKHVDFDQSPFLIIWEMTRACPLACIHCRASAQRDPLPGELSTQEGKKLIDDVVEMGCPIIIFSGGDPLQRKDLFELVSHAKNKGLRTATIPAASEYLNRDVLFRLKEAGLDQVAFSLDYPREKLHDQFRKTPGTFQKTLQAVAWAKEAGLPVQINTVITAETLPFLEEMAELVNRLGIVFWEVFFLVPVGRGEKLAPLSPELCEQAFEQLYAVHQKANFILKVTEAPHYRRFVAEKEGTGTMLAPRLRKSEGPGATMGHAPRAVNAGKGFMFVAYDGVVSPSGFLPKAAGNVKTNSLSELYRQTPLFIELRDSSKLLGKCFRCEYREICGGSRSRAFAMTKNPLASDPWCIHNPSPQKHAGESLPMMN
jgi:radical SAM protein